MDFLKVVLIRALLTFFAFLPLSVARAIGRCLALVYWPVGGRSRKVAQRNIELAFPALPAKEQQALARESVMATAELMAESGHVWLRSTKHVQSLVVSCEGDEQIRETVASGRGVIVLAPHLGNWEVVGLHVGTLGDLVSLYEPPKLAGLGKMIKKARERSGALLVPTDARGLAKLLKSVKRGKISGILPDQVPSDIVAGQNSLFFGVEAFTSTLASKMIHRTGALVVFGFARRVPGGFDIRFRSAEPDIYDEDLSVSLAALNRGVEECVRECIEQYQWVYKRFRVRPKNGPGVYDDL
ncbi:MAG: lysophospholipid acyltransferase family protein [Halioglobus sp.]